MRSVPSPVMPDDLHELETALLTAIGELTGGPPGGADGAEPVPLAEILMGVYFTILLLVTPGRQTPVSLPFCVLFMSGYYYVGLMSLFQSRQRKAATETAPAAAPIEQPAD